MLPLLRWVADQGECATRDAIEALAQQFQLSQEDRRQLLPKGGQPIFDNRVYWARTYLKEAGLLEAAGRGRIRITQLGRDVSAKSPERIDVDFLEQFEAFRAFRARRRDQPAPARRSRPPHLTPDEAMSAAYQRYVEALETELLDRLKTAPPAFFERVVADVLVAMGYGGSNAEAAQVIGGAGDEGIDAVIDQDPLGLDRVYVQAKRWDHSVGRPKVQEFAGALQGRGATKGVFITTGQFTKEAEDFAARLPNRVVLVDGRRLVQLMIQRNVGVTVVRTFEIKRVDADYFEEP
jgi:restriction system protein